ncbi:MmcQ/YjbR family DNA-binding protein [Sorangium sp. So ce176]|uniref:MmcQ/YjbR family DNA-binding protein n=1 Tax=Sorangium sp. So ce176 TaxID=3133286 RepID=UPI003F60EB4E
MMTTKDDARFTPILARLRDAVLAYPEAVEEFPWGDRVAKVRGKIFVFLNTHEGKLTVTAKLPESGDAALMLPFAAPTGYNLGKSGWVTARFGPKDKVPEAMLLEWIEESYRAVAPKRALQSLDGAAAVAGKKGAREGAAGKRGAKEKAAAAGKKEAKAAAGKKEAKAAGKKEAKAAAGKAGAGGRAVASKGAKAAAGKKGAALVKPAEPGKAAPEKAAPGKKAAPAQKGTAGKKGTAVRPAAPGKKAAPAQRAKPTRK